MKFSIRHIGLIVLSIVLAAYFFTSLGPRLRGYVGRFISKNAVALKKNKQLSEDAYEWQLMDLDGNPAIFKREKDKTVFLNFWATWCTPCLKEMPDIQKLYDAYGDRVDFLLVTQEDSAKVNRFLKRKAYNLPIYYANESIPDILVSKSLPTTYIIDKTGRIVIAETGGRDWNDEDIKLLLDSLLQKSSLDSPH